MSPLARDILEGLNSALAHAKGKPTPGTVDHVVLVPDVKAIREALGLSQSELSDTYNIPLPTLKGWELLPPRELFAEEPPGLLEEREASGSR